MINRLLKKIGILPTRLKEFYLNYRNLGLVVAIINFFWFFIEKHPSKLAVRIIKHKHRRILIKLSLMLDLKISIVPSPEKVITDPLLSPIWVCWLQGENVMPSVVEKCFSTIKKHAQDHPVNLITLTNYKNYVYVPSYIVVKYESKIIGHAHFTDILRTCLLYEHGGMWIDATVFVIKDFPIDVFTKTFYSVKYDPSDIYVTKCKWSNFMMSCQRHNILMFYTRDLFFRYLSKYDSFIDYFMMDYFMFLGYSQNPEIKKMIDELDMNNQYVHKLESMINRPFEQKVFDQLSSNTYLFKLTYRHNYSLIVNNRQTYWSHLNKLT